jgi:hypothetical protein
MPLMALEQLGNGFEPMLIAIVSDTCRGWTGCRLLGEL